MSEKERIEKIIALSLNVTRTQAKAIIRQKRIKINGKVAKCGGKADPKSDLITKDGRQIDYKKFVYIMMNKPAGIISSTDGKSENSKTVLDLLPDEMKRANLFPAGRLDKDTTGFVLITDDGVFAHEILSPKKHVPKTYIVSLDKPVTDELINNFKKGFRLGSEFINPAEISILSPDAKKVKVIISQGKYHQIKRMFSCFGITVVGLKRTAIGALLLDDSLNQGQSRYITDDELKKLKGTF